MTVYKKRKYLRLVNGLITLYLVPLVICRFVYDLNWLYSVGIASMIVSVWLANKLADSCIDDWYHENKLNNRG